MKVITKNRRANFDYAIERALIAGVVLNGAETKSIRTSLVSLKGAFAQIKQNELWLINMHVTRYPHAADQNIATDPTRPRKLLVSARELAKLQADREAGRSIVPLAVLAGRYIKIKLGIGRGKKKFDKRQSIKKRETQRNIDRNLRNRA